jgi:hypothetical protein
LLQFTGQGVQSNSLSAIGKRRIPPAIVQHLRRERSPSNAPSSLGFIRDETTRQEVTMSSEQILESVSYLLWGAGFAVLGLCLAAATVSYRRWLHRQPPREPLSHP